MKNFLVGFVVMSVILALVAAVPGPPSTAFSRSLLQTTNAAEAVTLLGISSGGGSTNPASVYYVTNLFSTNVTAITINTTTNLFNVAKGGHLTITNDFNPQQVGAGKLAGTDSSGNLTNVTLTGDATTTAGGLVTTVTNLPKNRISTSSTWAVGDIPSLPASQITSGTISTSRFPALVADLGNITPTTGDLFTYNGVNLSRIPASTAALVLTANGAGVAPTWQAAAAGGVATAGSAYSIIGGNAIATNNWVALSNAYVTAKAATPHGSALGASNRYTIFLLPGTYDMTAANLVLDTLYIDIVGLSENTGSVTYQVAPAQGDTIIKSSTTPIILNTTADSSSHDIALINMCLVSSSNDSTNSTLSVNQAGFGSKFYAKNINFVLTGAGARVHQFDKNFNGTWIDCRAFHNRAFGLSSASAVTLNGTFIRCKTDTAGFLGEYNAFGNFLSGTFIDCEGGGGSFGGIYDNGDMTVSGTFVRCRYVYTQGSTSGSLFGGQGGTITGATMIDCDAGTQGAWSFGGGPPSGTLLRCSGSVGWTAAPTATINNCMFTLTGWGQPYAMNTADSTTITNTASETVFSLTKTITRADWKIGRAFRWSAWGKYSATNTLPGTLTFKTKFGTTVANTSDALALPAAGCTNLAWKAEGLFVCRTTGATGTVSSQSHWEMDQGTLGVLNESIKPSNGTTTVAMNAAVTFQMSVTFSVAANSNGINLENFLLEPLNTP